MKRSLRFLLVVILVLVSFGQFILKGDRVHFHFSETFRTSTVNVVVGEDKADKEAVISKMEQLAHKHKISLLRMTSHIRGGLYKPINFTFHVFLSDKDWFQQHFPNVELAGEAEGLNQLGTAPRSDFLTYHHIKVAPLRELKQQYLTGNYYAHGKEDQIQAFIEDLNSEQQQSFRAVLNPYDNEDYSNLRARHVDIYFLIEVVMVLVFLFGLLIYYHTLTREFSIASLLGISKPLFFLEKIGELFVPAGLVGFALSNVLIFLLVSPGSLLTFYFLMKDIYLVFLCLWLSLAVAALLLLWLSFRGLSLVSLLKGYRKTYRSLLFFAKSVAFGLASYCLAVALFSGVETAQVNSKMSAWQPTQHYGNISITYPILYTRVEGMFKELVDPKLGELWNKLEEKGGILFHAPNMKLEGRPSFPTESAMFAGRYAFVNQNYLKVNPVLDKQGKAIDISPEKGEWIVLVPEDISVSENDRTKVRSAHKLQTEKEKVSERYIQIQKGQSYFTFDSEKELDNPYLKNNVLILINSSDTSAHSKGSAISLGRFHPYLKNPKQAVKEVLPFIQAAKSESYTLWVDSTYDKVQEHMNNLRIESIIYFFVFIFALVVLLVVLNVDYHNYQYDERKRITVSKLLGYGFMDIHRKKILMNFLALLFSIAVCVGVVWFSNYFISFGLYEPRAGWTTEHLLISVGINLLVGLVFIALEIYRLKKDNKELLTNLKEGN